MINEIGETAGMVWIYLETEGEMSIAKLKKDLNLKSETLLLSLGWLAREGKIDFIKKGASVKLIAVKQMID